MSTLARRLIILALGLLAGLCAWPVVEVVLRTQGSFASYRLFLPVLGAVAGPVIRAFLTSNGTARSVVPDMKSSRSGGAMPTSPSASINRRSLWAA